MAAAIALDAFYAAVKEHIDIPEETRKAWREKGTARYKQVVETLRRAFLFGMASLRNVVKATKDVYRFRDMAVHPDQKLAQTPLHPVLGVGTEWRFVAFRLENARPLVAVVLSMIWQMLERPREGNDRLARYCSQLVPHLKPLVERWEAKYGPIHPGRAQSPPEPPASTDGGTH
jgi:hypothetical protein